MYFMRRCITGSRSVTKKSSTFSIGRTTARKVYGFDMSQTAWNTDYVGIGTHTAPVMTKSETNPPVPELNPPVISRYHIHVRAFSYTHQGCASPRGLVTRYVPKLESAECQVRQSEHWGAGECYILRTRNPPPTSSHQRNRCERQQ